MGAVQKETLGEEIANSVIHGLGIVLSIAGLGVLTAFASLNGNAWHIVSCSIFSTTLILLYTASTLYHAITHPVAKRVLRTLDHAAIYLLIAGTYTPLALGPLRQHGGWIMFGVIWACAVCGIAVKSVIGARNSKFSTVLYVVMGWAGVAAIFPLYKTVGTGGLVWMFAGGLAYTLGVFFYVWRRLRFNHAIWHSFVLLGSVLHFFMILRYVVPN
ncbi:MAG: hemolysin III family protein [Acidobacteria bacterium]|nr:hemolysin III family protein [Acidobacteriota bacterium]